MLSAHLPVHQAIHQRLCNFEAYTRLYYCVRVSHMFYFNIPAHNAKRMSVIQQIILTLWALPYVAAASAGTFCLLSYWRGPSVCARDCWCCFQMTLMLKWTPDGYVLIPDMLCDCTGKSTCAQKESETGCTSGQIHK